MEAQTAILEDKFVLGPFESLLDQIEIPCFHRDSEEGGEGIKAGRTPLIPRSNSAALTAAQSRICFHRRCKAGFTQLSNRVGISSK